MTCPICQSGNIVFLKNFTPYTDKEWWFPIYDCSNCLSRYAQRDENINYHNILHQEQKESTYQPHYRLAEQVAGFIDRQNMRACERFLRKNNFMHGQVLDFIGKQKGKKLKILELGCSSGYFTAFLNAKGIETYGADISTAAINKAKDLFKEYQDHFSEAPQHATYDVVFHKGVISCVNDPVKFLHFNLELLNPEGRLIFNMSNIQSTRKLDEVWTSTPPPDVIYLFHEQAIKHLIKDQKPLKVTLTKHLDYFLLFKKYISLLRKRPFNKYPRLFHKKNKAGHTPFLVTAAVTCIAFATKLLVKTKLIKVIDEDFGTVVKITRQL